MADIKEFNKKIEISIGAVVFTVASIIMGTFSLTTIYNQFLFVQSEIIRVEGRLDKITTRDRKAAENKIIELEAGYKTEKSEDK